jgi:hypothetical protein
MQFQFFFFVFFRQKVRKCVCVPYPQTEITHCPQRVDRMERSYPGDKKIGWTRYGS